jgi:hypothetical protein
MLARNAAAPETGDGFEGRESDRSRGKRDHFLTQKVSERLVPGLPDTTMARAFLRALRRWLDTHRHHTASIAIPTGTVSDAELARVLRAIFSNKQREQQ